jgi:hypothetical protein
MTWLKRILIGLAIAVVLVIAIILMVSHWSPGGQIVETMSMTVGNRTITVSGHYKTMTQETLADGMKIVVDGHVIAATPGEITIDGKPQSFEPDQDVEVTINEKGGVEAKAASSDGGEPEAPVN